MGLFRDAGGLGCGLAPSCSSSTKISPPLGRKHVGKGWEVVGISVDITDDEGGPHTSQRVVAEDGLEDRVSRSRFGCVAMGPSEAINVVPVTYLGSLALAMRHELSAPKVGEFGKLWASGGKWQAGVVGEGYGSNASAGLAAIGVRASEVQLTPMHGTEIEGESGHGSLGSAVLLEEGDISTPLSKPFSIRGKVGNVFGLDDGEASAWLGWWSGFRDGLDELISFPLHR